MSLPYFPMYPKDFEGKTSHLTLEEDGAYNRLLRLQWMNPTCRLPNDDAWLMRRMRVDQETFDRVVSIIISEFFTKKGAYLYNQNLLKIYKQSGLAHSKRVSAGKQGGHAKARNNKDKQSSNAVAMPYQPELEPEPYKKDTKVSTKRSSQFPDDWMPNEKTIQTILGKGYHDWQIGPMVDDCIQFHKSKGTTFKSFEAALITWASNQIKYHGSPDAQRKKHNGQARKDNGSIEGWADRAAAINLNAPPD